MKQRIVSIAALLLIVLVGQGCSEPADPGLYRPSTDQLTSEYLKRLLSVERLDVAQDQDGMFVIDTLSDEQLERFIALAEQARMESAERDTLLLGSICVYEKYRALFRQYSIPYAARINGGEVRLTLRSVDARAHKVHEMLNRFISICRPRLGKLPAD